MNHTFLQQVAASLLERFGNNLSSVVVVFPGKRASLFLNQRLAELAQGPVWTPVYSTISELFVRNSTYALCDPVESICRLYRSYARLVEDPQTLDQFYGWGEVLLNDFDDVDKHLVDAEHLFANIHDIKELDNNNYITPEQEEALRSFFVDFSVEGNTLLKERFLRLWNKMFDIYTDFRTHLEADGLYYEGALQRDLVERLRASRFDGEPADGVGQQPPLFADGRTYVFVGLNVLNDVEKALFDELQRRQRALFYWDYDISYANPRSGETHEAGYFIRQNMERYGNALDSECFDNFSKPKQLAIVTASSENIQARYVSPWLKDNLTSADRAPEGETYAENQTAVVLCNEQLLLPVLHSLPPEVKSLNVTMGYPLADTSVYSFISVLLDLQIEGYDASRRRFRNAQVAAVARHPLAGMLEEGQWQRPTSDQLDLVNYLIEILATLGKALGVNPPDKSSDVLLTESVFVAYKRLNRILDLMTGTEPLLDVGSHMLARIIRSVLTSQTVPFHGEPAIGLQVMGVLETRVLDFRHVLMLSVGEGFLPKAVSDNSFIPYHLKDAFGLTTLRHKIAVYAYYFYRLIQRAERVTFVYNESNVGTRQNESSRFLRQLLAETNLPITNLQLQAACRVPDHQTIEVPKTEEVLQHLYERYDNTGRPIDKRVYLSPSAINRYTTCPLKFYYRYVCDLPAQVDNSEAFDAVAFGNVFHHAADLLYKKLTDKGKIVFGHDIETMLEGDGYRLDLIIRKAFREGFFKDKPEEYTGILVIAQRVVKTYLLQLLRYDLKLAPIRIIGLEKARTTSFQITSGQRQIQLATGGVIDRLDEVTAPDVEGGRAIRVVDYKTGGSLGSVAELDRLFHEAGEHEQYFLQTVLYASIVAEKETLPVVPCLFYIHRANKSDYSPLLKYNRSTVTDVRLPLPGDKEPLMLTFMERLKQLCAEIFDPEVPFRQTTKPEACLYCDYRLLCGR